MHFINITASLCFHSASRRSMLLFACFRGPEMESRFESKKHSLPKGHYEKAKQCLPSVLPRFKSLYHFWLSKQNYANSKRFLSLLAFTELKIWANIGRWLLSITKGFNAFLNSNLNPFFLTNTKVVAWGNLQLTITSREAATVSLVFRPIRKPNTKKPSDRFGARNLTHVVRYKGFARHLCSLVPRLEVFDEAAED